MFEKEDTTYTDLRKKSLDQWLDDMKTHDDVTVRGGVALVESYIRTLEIENSRLKEENELKNSYLKKLSGK